MKNKLLTCILCLVLLLPSNLTVWADNGDNATDWCESVADGILTYKMNESGTQTLQELIDGTLSSNAGISSEWYILGLSQSINADFSKYESSLIDYLGSISAPPVSEQKYALCLSSVGSIDGYISHVLDNTVGKQGIMSFVFGLHLLNNGYVSKEHTVGSVTQQLLSLQCADGGWSLRGDVGDVDVTAMTVQALSVYYGENADVRTAIDAAVSFLSDKQLPDGDFATYGVSNSESTAQVLIALCSIGIDFSEDQRFIKNGNTLLDGIEKYRLTNGGFCHVSGGEFNENATSQLFFATVAYKRMQQGLSPVYILDCARADEVLPHTPDTPDTLETDGTQIVINNDNENEKIPLNYKTWVCIFIICAGIIACGILLLLKKRNIKNFIAVAVASAITIIGVAVTDLRSADDYYNGEDIVKENPIGTVTLSVRCDKIVGKASHIPSDGIILDEAEFTVADGDTVYTILTEAARKYGLRIENNGSTELAYISGINSIYETDFGNLSGWVYLVDGVSPSVGCSEYKLSDGQRIEWHYSLDLGQDIGGRQ